MYYTPYENSNLWDLFDAIRNQSIERCQDLIARGRAGVNSRNKDNLTPLMVATKPPSQELSPYKQLDSNASEKDKLYQKERALEICNLLIANKADVHVLDADGWSPLLWAATNGNELICKALIAHGTDIDIQGKNGWTPLMSAAFFGHEKSCDVLLKSGANHLMRDHVNFTALTHANCRRQNDQVLSIFKEHKELLKKRIVIFLCCLKSLRTKNACAQFLYRERSTQLAHAFNPF